MLMIIQKKIVLGAFGSKYLLLMKNDETMKDKKIEMNLFYMESSRNSLSAIFRRRMFAIVENKIVPDLRLRFYVIH